MTGDRLYSGLGENESAGGERLFQFTFTPIVQEKYIENVEPRTRQAEVPPTQGWWPTPTCEHEANLQYLVDSLAQQCHQTTPVNSPTPVKALLIAAQLLALRTHDCA